MAKKLPIINLALFGFLTISLGIEVSVPLTLVASGLYGGLVAIVSFSLNGRRSIQAEKPDITGIAPTAQTLCSANH